jgi:serine/threonine-protein kinase RsbW
VSGQQALAGHNAQPAAMPWLWWWQKFRGAFDQVAAARRWVKGILPGCDPRDDLVAICSELAANACKHTRSGQQGGSFTVQLGWSGERARIVVGDGGSGSVPTVVHGATGPDKRGLEVVEALACNWGIAGDADGRWVWADVPWARAGGKPLDGPASGRPTAAEEGVIMQSFPGSRAWFGTSTRTWLAFPPEAAALIEAPSPEAAYQMLARSYRSRRSPPAAPAVPGAPEAPRFVAAPVMPAEGGG